LYWKLLGNSEPKIAVVPLQVCVGEEWTHAAQRFPLARRRVPVHIAAYVADNSQLFPGGASMFIQPKRRLSSSVFQRLQLEVLERRCLLSYAFTKIADMGDALSSFGDAPAINSNGTVAFLAHPVNDGVRQVIFTGDGGDLTRIAAEGPLDVSLNPQPSIADDGTVAFVWSFHEATHEIRLSDGVNTTTLYATDDSFFTSFGSPAISQGGTVAFWASTLILSNPEGIFRDDGGTPTFIDRGDSFDTTHFGRLPSVNNGGIVAYRYEFQGPVYHTSINIGDGQTTTELYPASSATIFSSFGNPVINDANRVAFFATLQDGSSGIFSGDGGPLTIHAQTGDGILSLSDAPAINNMGDVAFIANFSGNVSVLFAGDGSQAVIGTGDALDGSTVTDLHFFRQGLNDSGQLAFMARLADGTSGIYRADPQPDGARRWGPGVVSFLVSRAVEVVPEAGTYRLEATPAISTVTTPRQDEASQDGHIVGTNSLKSPRLARPAVDLVLAEVVEPGSGTEWSC
jgi:hypothetical protein